MIKGMFCLLPMLALCQVAISTPHSRVDESTVLVPTRTERVKEAPVISTVTVPRAAPRVVTTTAPGLVTVKSVGSMVPRSGRNNRLTDGRRILIRR